MRRCPLVTIPLLACLCLLAAAVWAAHTWYVQTADSMEYMGGFVSAALDSSGYPHISYLDAMSGGMKHAWWNGTAWEREPIEARGISWETSLALDSSGRPHIAYGDWWGSPEKLRYARWDGSSWVKETVETSTSVYRWQSLALDSTDRPHLAYCEEAADDLKYGVRSGAGWSLQTVDGAAAGLGYCCSLALVPGDPYPARIAYFDATNGLLKYARQTGATSWDLQTVVSNQDSYCSLALDSSAYPRIAYHDGATSALRCAAWNGASWDIETVGGSEANADGDPCLAIDSADRPRIAYVTPSGLEVRYAEWNGATWDVETTASVAGILRFDPWVGLALTATDGPHVTYAQASSTYGQGRLLHAVTAGPLPVRWPRE